MYQVSGKIVSFSTFEMETHIRTDKIVISQDHYFFFLFLGRKVG